MAEGVSPQKIVLVFYEEEKYPTTFFRILQLHRTARMREEFAHRSFFQWTPNLSVSRERIEQWPDSERMIASTRIEFADITGYSFEKASPTLRSGFQNTLLFILYCIMLYSSWGFAEQRKPNRLVLEIFHRDSPKPSLSISCDAPNFYPGWENARRLLPVQEGIYWELYT